MPIAITLATIALLRGGGNVHPFFDANALREMLVEGLEAGETLDESLALTDALEGRLGRYRASVDATIDAYIDESRNPGASAEDLIEEVVPLDRDRAEILQAIIDYRRQLIGLLDEEQWDNIFS